MAFSELFFLNIEFSEIIISSIDIIINIYSYNIISITLLIYIYRYKEVWGMEVGKRISFFRQQQGLTINKLANLAGISQSYLRDIELGNKQPTVEYLSYICDALNISLSDFFDDSVQKKISEDPLIKAIFRLNERQKEALLAFLNTLK